MKKLILLLGIIATGLAAFVFISKTNDHKECHVRSYQSIGKDGSVVTHTEHICNEKFSF